MRAIFIFFILSTFLMTGCTTIDVAKGVTKATQSLETSIKKIFESPDEKEKKQKISTEEEKQKIIVEEQKISTEETREQKIIVEKQKISKEQKMISAVVKKQKKISTIKLLGKTMKELNHQLGQPRLIREDGKTTTARFDSKSCRLFVFMNSTFKTPRVEYYELRNSRGELIKHQKDIELCFKEIKPV